MDPAEALLLADVGRDDVLERVRQRDNFVVGPVRPRIGPVFGTSRHSYGLARARAFTLTRNLGSVTFRIPSFDLRRALTLPSPVRWRAGDPSVVRLQKTGTERPDTGVYAPATRSSSETVHSTKG